MTVEDNDLGFRRIMEEMKSLDKSYSKVGLPEEGTVKAKRGSEITTMSELVKVGAANEFGAPKANVPERSFIRAGSDQAKPVLNKMISNEYSMVLFGTSDVKTSVKKLGVFMAGQIKKKIRNLKFPPNKPSTIRKKGSSNPLIDKGQMVQSITNVEVFG